MTDRAIVHLAPASPFGGLQRVAIRLAAAERNAGRNASIMAIGRNAALDANAASRSVPLLRSGEGRTQGLAALAGKLRRVAPRLHVHATTPRIAALVALSGRPVDCLHLHLMPAGDDAPVAVRVAERVLRERATATAAVSEPVARAARAIGFPKVHVVPNGLEAASFAAPRNRSAETPTVGMAGRLVPGKGWEAFLDVAAAIRAERPDVRFSVAGEGPLGAALCERARALGLDCAFHGHVADMARFWGSLDVALFLADADTFGLGLIEPVAAGVPTVGWIAGSGSDDVLSACPSILRTGRGDVAGTARRVIEVLTDARAYAAASAGGVAEVRAAYAIESVVARLAALCDGHAGATRFGQAA